MIAFLDSALDGITMYRLVLYVLLGYIGITAVLAAVGLLPFTPIALLVSVAFVVAVCWAANRMLAWAFAVNTNVESSLITALILALILDPARAPGDAWLLGWAAVLAMGSKYLLALYHNHVFNPAAIAVVITAFALGQPASWWVGAPGMLPVVLLGGLLIVRKTRQESLVLSFLAAALLTLCAVSLLQQTSLVGELQKLVVASPLFFLATIMLTEPLTVPPTQRTRQIYGLLTGFLFVPAIHVAQLYSTPELALIAGNLYAYLVSPRLRVALTLRKKTRLSLSIVDFAFVPSRRLNFAPGQYIECTLAHAQPDSRGNRRYFTIASSPTEPVLHLGVRFDTPGSSFKRALRALDGQTPLSGAQIAGDFTLPADRTRKLAFIAGGIGITPYRSMLRYLIDTKQRRDIVLLYANRTADEIVYRDILGEAQARLGTKVFCTLTDTATIPANWTGLRGRPDEQMLRQVLPDFAERIFYLSGPPRMVRDYQRVLRQLRVPRAQIKTDFFPGLV